MKIQNPPSVTLPPVHPALTGSPLLSEEVFLMEEIWKQIPSYPNYEASSLGRIKSLNYKGVKGKHQILNPQSNPSGYKYVSLVNDSGKKTRSIHQIICITFLDHIPNGFNMVVNHKNFIRSDNRLSNLEIITIRDNSNQSHIPHSSKYIGVSWHKRHKCWVSSITHGKERVNLGCFKSEEEASKFYEDALVSINSNMPIKIKITTYSSIFKGVSYDKKSKKWVSYFWNSGKLIYLGSFSFEIDAYNARQNKLKELNLLK